MPEGPEICITAQYLKTKLKGRTISKLEVLSGRYTHAKLKGAEHLNGDKKYKVKDISSKGKLLWFKMESKAGNILYLINRFGLTGGWSFHRSNSDRIRLTIVDEKKNKTYQLYYYDDRNFGTIELTKDITDLTNKCDALAPDLLKTSFTPAQFMNWIKLFLSKSKKRNDALIGKILMNQNASDGIGSGIGNYLMPEILYDAKISPFRTVGSLSESEIEKLGVSIKKIIKLSYYNNATGYMTTFSNFVETHRKGIDNGKYSDYHKDIKFKATDKFEFKVYRQKTDKLGNKVENDKTINNGRTTYWVLAIQK